MHTQTSIIHIANVTLIVIAILNNTNTLAMAPKKKSALRHVLTDLFSQAPKNNIPVNQHSQPTASSQRSPSAAEEEKTDEQIAEQTFPLSIPSQQEILAQSISSRAYTLSPELEAQGITASFDHRGMLRVYFPPGKQPKEIKLSFQPQP